jgi:hypothetical protein
MIFSKTTSREWRHFTGPVCAFILTGEDSGADRADPSQPTATGFLFSKFLASSNANAICSTPQSS